MIAYKDALLKMRTNLWPGKEPQTLKTPHTDMFLVAMIGVQRDLETLQAHNISVTPFLASYHDCAKTVVAAPLGKIRHVYTIVNGNWCDRVYYRQSAYEDVVKQARTLIVASPANVGYPTLPQGIRFAQPSTDLIVNGFSCRARTGQYAIRNGKIWITPWIQSNESVVVEWDGIRAEFKDDDVLDEYWNAQTFELVKLRVEEMHERRFGDGAKIENIQIAAAKSLADLMHDERENTWIRNDNPELEGSYFPTRAELQAEAVPDLNTAVSFWVIADSGSNDANQDAVAALIANNVKDFGIIAGDITYDDEPYANVVEAKYSGLVLPARGNHDYDFNAGADYEAYFASLHNSGVMHEYVNGPAHFLFGPSDPREPLLGYIDATTSTENGPFAQWVKAKVLLSPAKFIFLVFHHTSHTSGTSHGPAEWMKWDLDAMGIADRLTAVFMGHNHEFEVILPADGVYRVTSGLGGKTHSGFGAPAEGSLFRYEDDYGALFNSITCNTWSMDFRNTAGESVYSLEVTK